MVYYNRGWEIKKLVSKLFCGSGSLVSIGNTVGVEDSFLGRRFNKRC